LVLAGGDLGANERVQLSRQGDVAGLICGHEALLHEALRLSKIGDRASCRIGGSSSTRRH
jgi:hypothetical protein